MIPFLLTLQLCFSMFLSNIHPTVNERPLFIDSNDIQLICADSKEKDQSSVVVDEFTKKRKKGYSSCSLSLTSDDRALLSYTLRDDGTSLRSHRFLSIPISWFYKN